MASVQKRGDVYYITVSNGFDHNGKRIRYKTKFIPDPTFTPAKRKKALERFIVGFEDRVQNGISMDGEKLTFQEFAEIWLKDVAKKKLVETTYVNYERNLRTKIYPHIGSIKRFSERMIKLMTQGNLTM